MSSEFPELQPVLGVEPSVPFFSTPALNGLKQQVNHLAQFGGSLIIVEGEPGSGKSVFASNLYSSFLKKTSSSDVLSILLSVTDQESIDSFFPRLCGDLGLPVDARSIGEYIVVVRSYVQSLVREHKLCLIFIDDADLLNDETLVALLSILDAENVNHGIHLVFMSQPGLISDIDRLNSVSLAAYDFSMPNFSPGELERFIEFVLPAEFPALFSDDGPWTAQSLWAKSRGFPGQALALIAESQSAFDEHDQRSNKDAASGRFSPSSLVEKAPIPLVHAGILVVLLGSLIWVFLNGASDSENIKEEASSFKVKEIPVLARVPSKSLKEEGDKTSAAARPALSSSTLSRPQSDARAALLNDPDESGLNKRDLDQGNLNIQGSQAREELKESKLRSGLPQSGVTKKAADKKILELEVKKAASEPKVAEAHPADKAVVKGSRALPKAVTQPSKSAPTFGGGQNISKDESFLLSLPSSHYVLQILAASKSDTLQKFIDRQSNKKDLRLYQGSREGKAWYIVVIASFESRSAAISAIKSLPAEQSKSGPWAKPISTVIAEIKENRRI